jgi:hypothetical protein
MSIPGFFQVLSRQNDHNGNPYRLTVIYDEKADICKLVEEQCSRPNIVHALVQEGYPQLPDIFLSISEYNSWKRGFKRILEHA